MESKQNLTEEPDYEPPRIVFQRNMVKCSLGRQPEATISPEERQETYNRIMERIKQLPNIQTKKEGTLDHKKYLGENPPIKLDY
jgi:hypothetical protein